MGNNADYIPEENAVVINYDRKGIGFKVFSDAVGSVLKIDQATSAVDFNASSGSFNIDLATFEKTVFNQDITVKGDCIVEGTLAAPNVVQYSNDFLVKGDLTVEGETTLKGVINAGETPPTHVGNDLSVDGQAFLNKRVVCADGIAGPAYGQQPLRIWGGHTTWGPVIVGPSLSSDAATFAFNFQYAYFNGYAVFVNSVVYQDAVVFNSKTEKVIFHGPLQGQYQDTSQLFVDSGLSVTGDSSLSGGISSSTGRVDVKCALKVSGATTLSGTTTVEQPFQGRVITDPQDTYGREPVTVDGRLVVNETLHALGGITSPSPLFIRQSTTILGDLTISGNFTWSTGDATIARDCVVGRDVILSGKLHTANSTPVQIIDGLNLYGGLNLADGHLDTDSKYFTFDKKVKLNDGITSDDASIAIEGSIDVYDDVRIGGYLGSGGPAVRIDRDLSVTGKITTPADHVIFGKSVEVRGDVKFSGDLSSTGKNIVLDRTAEVRGDLYVTGSIIGGGDIPEYDDLNVKGKLSCAEFTTSGPSRLESTTIGGQLRVAGGDEGDVTYFVSGPDGNSFVTPLTCGELSVQTLYLENPLPSLNLQSLTVSGSSNVGRLTAGSTTLSSLAVGGSTTCGTLLATGSTELHGLKVTSATTLDSLAVLGLVTCLSLKATGSTELNGVKVTDTTELTDVTSTGQATFQDLEVHGNVKFASGAFQDQDLVVKSLNASSIISPKIDASLLPTFTVDSQHIILDADTAITGVATVAGVVNTAPVFYHGYNLKPMMLSGDSGWRKLEWTSTKEAHACGMNDSVITVHRPGVYHIQFNIPYNGPQWHDSPDVYPWLYVSLFGIDQGSVGTAYKRVSMFYNQGAKGLEERADMHIASGSWLYRVPVVDGQTNCLFFRVAANAAYPEHRSPSILSDGDFRDKSPFPLNQLGSQYSPSGIYVALVG